MRRNTGFHWAKASLYNSTNNSFNEMLMSETPDQEIDDGLDYILNEFTKKAEFLQSFKAGSKGDGTFTEKE